MMKKILTDTVSLCLPIAASDSANILKRIAGAIKEGFNFLELRRDYLDIGEDEIINTTLSALRMDSKIGTIYTFRSIEEGGKKDITLEKRVEVIREAINSGACDYIDLEKRYFEDQMVVDLIEYAHQNGVGVIGSFHNFNNIPSDGEVLDSLDYEKRPDVVKAAFMCENQKDLINLILAGYSFKSYNPETPLILIAMGERGEVSRIFPELFSSNLTFCSLKDGTAPGQIDKKTLNGIRILSGYGELS